MCAELATHELSHMPHSSCDMASLLGGQRVSKSSSAVSSPWSGPAKLGDRKQAFFLDSFTDLPSSPFGKEGTSECSAGRQRLAQPRRQSCSLEGISR